MATIQCPDCGRSIVARFYALHAETHDPDRLLDRLLLQSEVRPGPAHRPELGSCWVWTGYTRNGYGSLSLGDRHAYTHRLSLSLHLGRELGPGMEACHHCDNRPCIRPSHLFEAPHVDNVDDMHAKARGVNPPRKAGMANHKATVTDDRVAAAIAAVQRGEEQRAVARRFGVSQSTIWRWLHGQTRTRR